MERSLDRHFGDAASCLVFAGEHHSHFFGAFLARILDCTEAQSSCRDLDKIALTVPSGNPVLFAIFRAPIPASRFNERTVRTVSSGRGGLPSFCLWRELP